jgi:hypothetical protein
MKSDRMFLIKTLSEPENGEKMLHEFAEIFDVGDEENYAVEDIGGLDYVFLRFTEYKVEKVCKVLDKYIRYTVEDITDRIIFGDEGELKYIIKGKEFKVFFNNFRLEVTRLDDVLDKIIKKGIEALDEVDRFVLASSENRNEIN